MLELAGERRPGLRLTHTGGERRQDYEHDADSVHHAAASRWPGDRFAVCPSTMSWPHAARMSRPRLFRTETPRCLAARIVAKRFTRSSDGRSKGMLGAAFSGIRFTLAFTPASSLTR